MNPPGEILARTVKPNGRCVIGRWAHQRLCQGVLHEGGETHRCGEDPPTDVFVSVGRMCRGLEKLHNHDNTPRMYVVRRR